MDNINAKLFVKAIFSLIDTRIKEIATDLSELFEPIAANMIEDEATRIIKDICDVIKNDNINSDEAITQIIKLLTQYNIDLLE